MATVPRPRRKKTKKKKTINLSMQSGRGIGARAKLCLKGIEVCELCKEIRRSPPKEGRRAVLEGKEKVN